MRRIFERRPKMVMTISTKTFVLTVLLLSAGAGAMSMLMPWFVIKVSTYYTLTVSGWDLFVDSMNDFDIDYSYVNMMPFIAFIFSFVAMYGVARSFYRRKRQPTIVIGGMGMIIAVLIFSTYDYSYSPMSYFMGAGAVITLIAGLVVLLGGAMIISPKSRL